MRRLFAAGAGILALTGCSNGSDQAAEETTVARVIDGDTIETGDGERIRLVQIDAPEIDEGECYAEEAAAALDELLAPGADIRLEADPRLDDVDRFGRLLRYVHAGEDNVNLELETTRARENRLMFELYAAIFQNRMGMIESAITSSR